VIVHDLQKPALHIEAALPTTFGDAEDATAQ
jgi:hypothetical protein